MVESVEPLKVSTPVVKVGSVETCRLRAALAGAALSTARVQIVASVLDASPAATPRKPRLAWAGREVSARPAVAAASTCHFEENVRNERCVFMESRKKTKGWGEHIDGCDTWEILLAACYGMKTVRLRSLEIACH